MPFQYFQIGSAWELGISGIAGLSAFEGNAVLSGLTGILGAFLAFQVSFVT
jgi:hypothetical protein